MTKYQQISIVCFSLAMLLTGISYGQENPEKAPSRVTAHQPAQIIGQPFPNVALRNLAADKPEMLSLSSFAGSKVVVGIFMANRCGATWVYDKKIAQLASDYAPKGLTVVAIHSNVEETDDEIKKQMADHKLSLPILDDKPQQTLAKYIGAHATPTFFVIDKEGILRYVGAFDRFTRQPAYLRPVLDALLAGKKPPYTRTNAPGCSLAYRRPAKS
jgi:peroxiredoxin